MQLKVIGSSSAGNGYILEGSTSSLLIEAGMPFNDLIRMSVHSISEIDGLIITHEHGDHARFVKKYIENGISVYASKGTLNELNIKGNILESLHQKRIGEFIVLPFPIEHDAAEPFGFLIHHNECGNVLFITDTMYVENRFRNLNNILIECNYDNEILSKHVAEHYISEQHEERILNTHMSIQHCIDTLKSMNLTDVVNIVLIHLSKENSNSKQFKQIIQEKTGKITSVAEKGTVMDLNKEPF